MKQTKLWLTTIAALLCSLVSNAYNFKVDDIYYNITSSQYLTVEVTTCYYNSFPVNSSHYTGTIIIPETVTYNSITYYVTSIGDWAFFGCRSLTSITIPEGVTSIGNCAFEYCSSLTSITIPESVVNIGGFAFEGCSSLTSITIPEGVTSIGNCAFYGCSSLTSIPENVTSIGSKAFYGTAWYENQLDGMVYAGKVFYEFKGTMPENTSIEIKEGVEGIAGSAFSGCSSLTSITIPESVVNIGDSAFEGCSSLTSITIPESVTSIGNYAFDNCTALKEVIFEDGSETLSLGGTGYAGQGLFYDCPLESVYLGRNLSYNPTSPFCSIANLNSIIIGDSVTSIGKDAFRGCSSLTSITIPESVTSIGNYTFYGCSSLTSITIPESVTSIGNYTFYGCSSLTSITIPEGVTSIGEYAFSSCSNLTSITIPESVTSIGNYTFSGCSSLTSITIPEGVTSIGGGAFNNCIRLTSITISEGVTNIGNYAFDNCTALKELIFEDGSKTLSLGYNGSSQGLFYACPLESVYLGRNLSCNTGSNYGYSPFYNKDALTHVTIGREVTAVANYAFYGCDNIHSLTINSGVLSIGSSAFSTPDKVIWLTNTPPTGYANAKGNINYAANDQYTSLSNAKVYPYLSSMFEVDGVKYVPVSPSERTCHAIDCAYDSTATTINVGETASFKGVAMKVTEVMPYTFYGNDYIKEVSVAHLGNIGDYAFYHCDGIKTIKVNNRGNIESEAFYGCNGIESASIANIGKVNSEAFSSCSSLQTVTLGDSIGSLGNKAFYQCTSLQEIVILDSVKAVGEYCFSGCSALKSAIIGDGVSNIAAYTFQGCTALEDVVVGDGVTTISNYAFRNCSSLPEISIPQATTTIGDYAFSGCTQLADVFIEDRNTTLSLGSNGSSPLFASCPLDSVYIGGKITYSTTSSKGYSPFYRNTSLRSVVITDREEQIYDNEFYGCTNLQNVIIGNGVKSIGNYAFSGCSSLAGFSFGSNMETIGDEAFSDCTNLTSITSHAAVPPTCGTQALDDINKWNCVLGVPLGHADAYYAADQWKEFFFIEDVVEVEKYTLNFIVDGEMYHTERLAHKSTIVIPEMPVKEGYTFNGWSEMPATMPAEDVTICGTFIINKYFVTFKIGDEIISSDSLEYGTEIVVPESPEREGHTFNGWGEVAETVPAGDVTYEGSYAVNSYILTFIVDDETILETSVPYGKEITLPETPVKEGYAFNGWSEVPATMPANDVVVYGSFAKLSVEVITINDTDSHFSVIEDTECGSINYIRDFKDTEWQALYVPFEIPVTEEFLADFEVADLNNVHQYDRDDDGVTDETVIEAFKMTSGTLEANYPYLIRTKEAGEKSITMTDAVLYATEENSIDCSSVRDKFTFTGTYSSLSSAELPQGEGYYTLIEGEWQPVTEAVSLGAFRFYLKVDSRSGALAAEARSIRMRIIGENGYDDDTSIDNSEFIIQNSELIYDLQGRRVENPTKGIYIVNGKRVVIK